LTPATPLARQGDPIVAIATAPGRGAVGIVRASGRDLAPLVAAVCGRALAPRHATLLPFLGPDGRSLDQGLAIHFPAPHSYTGEDVLELQAHGGPVLLQLLLARCLEAGASIGLRLAEPGEFTRRAFLNDKLDLAQAEAVADLIDASTEAAARSAARALAGEFSQRVDALAQRLLQLRTLVEATLDFPEEEIDFLEQADARGQLRAIDTALRAVLAAARQGALLREGLRVVIAGQPNVGKSSLLNALAGAELALAGKPDEGRRMVEESVAVEPGLATGYDAAIGIELHFKRHAEVAKWLDRAADHLAADPKEVVRTQPQYEAFRSSPEGIQWMDAEPEAKVVGGVRKVGAKPPPAIRSDPTLPEPPPEFGKPAAGTNKATKTPRVPKPR